ncbi:MAG: capsular biosynthesis protein CpsF [Parabacteroides sp.]|nr:capsular biosynthesis protein CpsF [Parabacteroides sp.]
MNVLFVCNTGGHYSQMLKLRELMKQFDSILLTDNKSAGADMKGYAEVINITAFNFTTHRPYYFILNFMQCIKIWLKYKPGYLITTGAGLAVPAFLVGKLFGSKLIFIETRSRVYSRSVTGQLLYRICDKVIVQWPEMVDVYAGKAEYYGTIV